MRLACFLLAFLICAPSPASDRSDHDDFAVYRECGRLRILSASAESRIFGMAPYWPWETRYCDRNSSTACFVRLDGGGVWVHWCIDIAGPDWLYVTLTDDAEETRVTVEHSRAGLLAQADYRDYADLLTHSGDCCSVMVQVMLQRSGCNPLLPQIEDLRNPSPTTVPQTIQGRIDARVEGLRHAVPVPRSLLGAFQSALKG